MILCHTTINSIHILADGVWATEGSALECIPPYRFVQRFQSCVVGRPDLWPPLVGGMICVILKAMMYCPMKKLTPDQGFLVEGEIKVLVIFIREKNNNTICLTVKNLTKLFHCEKGN